ncbi:restriction endonuclease subunit S [Actinoplanes sp. NBC_00393]|uniref:hypothetical protein n=1 Tax=Actinoplanes sp. NBC_00393 TaxID=2975953 RepID=UPI002E1E1586
MNNYVRAKFIFRRRDVRGVTAPLASATKAGVELRESLEQSVWNPGDDVSNYKLVEPDDFVIGLRSFQHGFSFSRVRGLVSPAYTVFRAAVPIEPRYYAHYFRSTLFVSRLANIAQGIRQGKTIDYEDFASLEIPQPSLEEQRRIADFLDAETARIGSLLTLRNRQRDLVGQREVQLVGEHYERLSQGGDDVVRLRHIVRRIEQGWSPECENRETEGDEWGVLKAGCVNGGVFARDQHKTLPSTLAPRLQYKLRRRDLLMSRASGSLDLIGNAAVVEEDPGRLLLCDKIYRIQVDSTRATPEFIALMLKAPQLRDLIRLGVSGAGGLANNLPASVVRDLPVPAVPVARQKEVVMEFAQHRARTASLTAALDYQIKLIDERQRALVTAAVTGQVDVTTARGD